MLGWEPDRSGSTAPPAAKSEKIIFISAPQLGGFLPASPVLTNFKSKPKSSYDSKVPPPSPASAGVKSSSS